MNFDSFARARDALYLVSVIAGITAGCSFKTLLHTIGFRKRELAHESANSFAQTSTAKKKSAARLNRIWTIILYLLSAAIFAVAVLTAVSKGSVYSDAGLFRIALFVAAAAFAGSAFPLWAGVPLIILGGAASVWLGAVFLRLPAAPADKAFLAAAESAYLRSSAEETGWLPPEQVLIRAGDLIPVVGGQIRYSRHAPSAAQSVFQKLFIEEDFYFSANRRRLRFSFIDYSNPPKMSVANLWPVKN
jgi:hypothetical protein